MWLAVFIELYRLSRLKYNIWFQWDYVRVYTVIFGMGNFDEMDFGNDDGAANLAVSDYRPVWAEFYTNNENDDGLVLL